MSIEVTKRSISYLPQWPYELKTDAELLMSMKARKHRTKADVEPEETFEVLHAEHIKQKGKRIANLCAKRHHSDERPSNKSNLWKRDERYLKHYVEVKRRNAVERFEMACFTGETRYLGFDEELETLREERKAWREYEWEKALADFVDEQFRPFECDKAWAEQERIMRHLNKCRNLKSFHR